MRDDDGFRDWLAEHDLEGHIEAFRRHDIGLASLPHLSDVDLERIGLQLGARRRLQAAVARLTRQSLPAQRGDAAGLPAERRHITVMFCDLVGSTALSNRLDPDDLRMLLQAYFATCSRILHDGGGFVARLVGDGVLAYFGYPTAREDAAECAVRAGLAIVDAMRALSRSAKEALDVRIGIASGLSVVSDIVGPGFSDAHAVIGPTPNLAARLQALAAPGTVVLSDETRRLAGEFFLYEEHGRYLLKGIEQSVRAWRALAPAPSTPRFDGQRRRKHEFVGRERELTDLQDAWSQTLDGRDEVVTLVGEAGIGKSRLLRAAVEGLSPPARFQVLMQCVPSQSGSPLYPLLDWLRRSVAPASDTDRAEERLTAWLGSDASDQAVTVLGELLGLTLDARTGGNTVAPDQARELLFDLIVSHLDRECATHGAGVLMVEDAHWMDATSKSVLSSILWRMRQRHLLVIITTRPGSGETWAPTAENRTLAVGPLSREHSKRLISALCNGQLPRQSVIDDILQKTDGVPLFIEELMANVLEAGLLQEDDSAQGPEVPRRPLDIPATLRDNLLARLERLDDTKEVARIGSAIGREFSLALLRDVTGLPLPELLPALDRLVQAELLFQVGAPPEAHYVFKHALVQQAAYDTLLRGDRQRLHRRIVEVVERHQPALAEREPDLMAHHCQQGGWTDREVEYLITAGRRSTRLVAIPEAMSCFWRAESALKQLEPSPWRDEREIDVILGMMEVGRFAILPSRLRQMGRRAHELMVRQGATARPEAIASILFQDGRAQLYSSRYADARRTFRRLRTMGLRRQSPSMERKPASAFGMVLCCQGLFNEALEYLREDNIGHYKANGSLIDYISGLGWMGYAGCQRLGPAALRWSERSMEEARTVRSPIYLAGAHVWRSHAHMALRQWPQAVADAQACVDISRTHTVPYLTWHAMVFLALCHCRAGDADAASGSLEHARALLATVEDGCWSLLDYLPAIEAEIAYLRGDLATAQRCADEAIGIASSVGGYFVEGMAYRVKALASLAQGAEPASAQAFFDHAIACHRRGRAGAELAFSAALWAAQLRRSGQHGAAQRWEQRAKRLAQRHGFNLTQCEFQCQ